MKEKWIVFFKMIMLVFFIWISPFGWQSFHFQALPRFASKLFTQHLSFPQIDITQTMNVMDMVKKEDIPYREIDIDTRTPIVSVVDKPSIGKSIYIYSTHQGETYLDMNGVKEASHVFADMLRKKGVEVVVEEKDFKKALNEQGLDYNDSYLISRNAVNDALMEHGGFDLMIDFHRDSLPRDNTFITSDGKNYAKLMCVLGGLSNHLSIIKERGGILFDKSNEQINGIMKPLLIREAYYNQDMSENMILIEVGSDQNTYQEVVNSLEILVNAVMKIWGEQ